MMKPMVVFALLPLSWPAIADPLEQTCLEQFPRSTHGLEGVLGPSWPFEDSFPQGCLDAGHDHCNQAEFLSQAAAVCIAEKRLPTAATSAELSYVSDFHWQIVAAKPPENTFLRILGTFPGNNWWVKIHPVSGEVVATHLPKPAATSGVTLHSIQSASGEAMTPALERYTGQLEHCLSAATDVHGEITVSFEVLSGRVSNILMVSNDTGNDGIPACVERKVRAWAFPATDHSGKHVVSWQFVSP